MKENIKKIIKEKYHYFEGVMGYRKINIQLKKENIFISLPTTLKYMQELNLKSIVVKKKNKVKYNEPVHKTFENVIEQNFEATVPNEKWCSDLTCIKLNNGKFVYACAIIDLYDRSIVGFDISTNMKAEFVKEVLKKAKIENKVKNSLIFHSDQGRQYTSKLLVEYCEKEGIIQSMSRKGTPYDNAVMESFFGKFKAEKMNNYILKDYETAKEIAMDYVHMYYNSRRPHSSLNGLTPLEKRYTA